MADEIEPAIKFETYKLILNRYKDLINEKESKSVSEIRMRVSPYDEFVKRTRQNILADMAAYDPKIHFLIAAQKAMNFVRQIKTCEFAFNFWMSFEEMDKLKIGTAMDKCILLSAILRSLESEDVRVVVSRKGNPFVRFYFNDSVYLFVPKSGSVLAGPDALNLFSNDPISYSFNDLVYENNEDQ